MDGWKIEPSNERVFGLFGSKSIEIPFTMNTNSAARAQNLQSFKALLGLELTQYHKGGRIVSKWLSQPAACLTNKWNSLKKLCGI